MYYNVTAVLETKGERFHDTTDLVCSQTISYSCLARPASKITGDLDSNLAATGWSFAKGSHQLNIEKITNKLNDHQIYCFYMK